MPFYWTPQLQFELDESEDFGRACSRKLNISEESILGWQFIKKSLDVRHKHPRFQATIQIEVPSDPVLLKRLEAFGCVHSSPKISLPEFSRPLNVPRVCIVGSGPSGLFAALTLVSAGFEVDIYERGKPVHERARDIAGLIHDARLNPESNVCFGEGGAGTYSDGKLMTRTKSKYIPVILDWFVQFGAQEKIRYESHPHIGTDRLMPVMEQMRQHLESHGVRYYFNTRVEDFVIDSEGCHGVVVDGVARSYDKVLLCVGHSADDIFECLYRHRVQMEPKALAVGVRVEHPRTLIDQIQYGAYAGHPSLPAAEYAVRFNHDSLPSVFSFCMCPGGRVVASQTTEDTRVVNGMSGSLRNGKYSNSALVVQVGPESFEAGPLGGLHWVRKLERKAASGCPSGYAPAQSMMDFIHGRLSSVSPCTTYRPGTISANLHHILPKKLCTALVQALPVFDRQMHGFVSSEANFIGIESRTSSPVRILRDETFQSVNCPGLYPLGEGAGYAGGITSCALDGIHAALSLLGECGAIR